MSALQSKVAFPSPEDLFSGLNGAMGSDSSRYLLAIAAVALVASAAILALIELGIVKGNRRVARLISGALFAAGILAIGCALAFGQ
jgi:hypothetical protein